jgi:hypothetical protein
MVSFSFDDFALETESSTFQTKCSKRNNLFAKLLMNSSADNAIHLEYQTSDIVMRVNLSNTACDRRSILVFLPTGSPLSISPFSICIINAKQWGKN